MRKSHSSSAKVIVHPVGPKPDPSFGGLEYWILDFLQFSRERYLILGAGSACDDVPHPDEGSKKHTWLSCSSSRSRWQPILYLLGLIRRRRYLGSHVMVHLPYMALFVRLLAPKSRIVLVMHNDFGWHISQRWPFKLAPGRLLYGLLERWALRSATLVWVQAEPDFRRVQSTTTRAKQATGWFNDEIFKVVPGERTTERPPNIVWAGRMDWVKDPGLALDIARRLLKETSASLHFVGSGPLADMVIKFTQTEGKGRAFHIKWLSREDLSRLLRDSEVLLHTAQREATPRIFLEALACGTRIVTPATADPEGWAVGASGTSSHTRDSQHIAELVKQIIGAPHPGNHDGRLPDRRGSQVVPEIEATFWPEK